MISEAQKKAKAKYRSQCKMVNVEFSPNDMELYEYLTLQQSKTKYIKDLIKSDMESKRA